MFYPCYIHIIFILHSYHIHFIFKFYSCIHIISILYPLYIYSMFAMLKMVASFGVICQNFGCLRPLWLCQQFAIENCYLVRGFTY